MEVKLSYVLWRDGRPRFVPPGHVGKLGFKGHDLKHPGGTWFSLDETKAWADANLEKIKAARGGDRAAKMPRTVRHTVAELMSDWVNSKRVLKLSKDTQKSYRLGAEACTFKPTGIKGPKARLGPREREPFGMSPVASVDKPALRAFFEYLEDARSLDMARLAVNSFSTAYNWASEDLRWKLPRHLNPRTGMLFEATEGRISVIEPKEFKALVEAADRMGRPSIGDCIYLGFYLGQRLSDRLKVGHDGGYEDGRRKLRQGKTDAVVRIFEVPALKARLAEARQRARELMLKRGTRTSGLILNETTGKRWDRTTYRHVFAEIRAEAATGKWSKAQWRKAGMSEETIAEKLAELNLMPKVAKRTDQDLRDTCVTLLARAGAHIHTICDVTGHSYKSVALILKHYLGNDPASADVALGNMAALVEAELA